MAKATKKSEKKVESVQTYSFKIIHYDNGDSLMERTNDGFSVLELMGMAALIQTDLHEVLKAGFKPTEIVRKSSNSPMIHKPKK